MTSTPARALDRRVRDLEVGDVAPRLAREGRDLGEHTLARSGTGHAELPPDRSAPTRRPRRLRRVRVALPAARRACPAIAGGDELARAPQCFEIRIEGSEHGVGGVDVSRMSSQIAGWLAAMRVMSRKPPASATATARGRSASARSRTSISVDGRELRHVTHDRDQDVVIGGRHRDHLGVHVVHDQRAHRRVAASPVAAVGVSTHMAPTKRSARASTRPVPSPPSGARRRKRAASWGRSPFHRRR